MLSEVEIIPENPDAKSKRSSKITANGVRTTGKQAEKKTIKTKKPLRLDAIFSVFK